MKITIRSDAGDVRELEFIRWEGDGRWPSAFVRWGVAGTYSIDLRNGHLFGRARLPVTNWRAEKCAELREAHAAWLRERSRPAALKAKGNV